jgi:hypothetical protein
MECSHGEALRAAEEERKQQKRERKRANERTLVHLSKREQMKRQKTEAKQEVAKKKEE